MEYFLLNSPQAKVSTRLIFVFLNTVLMYVSHSTHFATNSHGATVVLWISHLPCKPGVTGSIPGFISLSDETLKLHTL